MSWLGWVRRDYRAVSPAMHRRIVEMGAGWPSRATHPVADEISADVRVGASLVVTVLNGAVVPAMPSREPHRIVRLPL